MKKISFVHVFILMLATLFISHTASADNSSFGTVGIDKVSIAQDTTSVIKITPTFFNISEKDQPTIIEVSITDNYSKDQLINIDKLTSDIIDTALVIPKKTSAFAKTYSYTVPNIAKKSTYRVEVRILDQNRNLLFVKQSDVVTLGSDAAPKVSAITLQSWFEYDGKKYGLNDGPIVKADKKDTAFYVVEVNNTDTNPVIISTTYSTRKYAAEGAQFVKNEGSDTSTTIAKKSKQTIKIPAKYVADTGTFEGKIDISATQASSTVLLRTDGFRYMVGDVFIVITDVVVGTTTTALVVSKTIFDFARELTEEVLNSSTAAEMIAAQDGKMYTFTLSFKDAVGNVVTTQTAQFAWNDILPDITVPVSLSNKERGQITKVEVAVTDAQNVSIFKNSFPVTAPVVDAMNIKEIGVIVGLVFLILSLIGYFATRRKGWLIFILLFLAATLFIRYSNVFATTAITSGNFTMSGFANGGNYPANSKCYAHGYRGLTMQAISYPSPSTQFHCGDQITLHLNPINSTCGNNPAVTYFVINSMQGLTVTNSSKYFSQVFQKDVVPVYSRTVGGATTTYPLVLKINSGYSGTATLKGSYYQSNGLCKSQTGQVTFTFNNITCSSTCNCNGRNNVCNTGGVISTTTNATECALSASCGVTVSGNQAQFTTTVVHGLGTISYRDEDSGSIITNPITRTIPEGGSVTQNTIVTDAFDGLTAGASCTASAHTVVNNDTPLIVSFLPEQAIVPKGQDCKFSWQTENMSLCSFKVNGTDLTPGDGKVGSGVTINTFDGNNKLGVLTCISSSTPHTTLTASTTCRVNPEVRQQ